MASNVSRRYMLGVGVGVGLGAGALLALPGILRADGLWTAAAVPGDEERIVFEILRNGVKIGEHVVTLAPHDNGGLRAVTDVKISVRVLGITAYRYTQKIEEIWRDEQLVTLSSRTNDNGTRKIVEGARDGDVFEVVDKDGESRRLSGQVLTTTLWHRRTPYVSKLVGTRDGVIQEVSGESLGRETLSLDGGTVEAERYRLSGEFERDLWYDDRDRLVHVGFNTERDGSRVELQAVNPAG